jgi:hypothetical protein
VGVRGGGAGQLGIGGHSKLNSGKGSGYEQNLLVFYKQYYEQTFHLVIMFPCIQDLFCFVCFL